MASDGSTTGSDAVYGDRSRWSKQVLAAELYGHQSARVHENGSAKQYEHDPRRAAGVGGWTPRCSRIRRLPTSPEVAQRVACQELADQPDDPFVDLELGVVVWRAICSGPDKEIDACSFL